MHTWQKLLLISPLALLTTLPHAQKAGTRIGIVNVQTMLDKTPGGSGVAALRKKADADLGAQAKKIQDLQQKAAGRQVSAQERQTYDTLVKTYNTANANYQKQIAAQFAPVAGKVNAAVASAAKTNGYSIVLDYGVSQRSGLVIYADAKNVDLTQAAIRALRK